MPSSPIVPLLWEFYQNHRSMVWVNMAFLLLVPIQDVLLPHFYGNVMDAMRANRGIVRAFMTVVVLLVVTQVLFLVSDFHDAKLLPVLQSFIRDRMVANVIQQYETNHKELETGTIISKIIKLPATIGSWFERMKNYIIPYMLVFLVTTFYYMYIDVQLGLALLVVMVIFVSIMVMSPKVCSREALDRDQHLNTIHEEIDDVFRNLFSIYGANQQQQEIHHLQRLSERFFKLFEGTVECCLKLKVWLTPLILIYLMFFLYRCYTLVQQKKMTASGFLPLFIILLYILNSMYILNDQLRDTVFEWGVIQSCADLLAPPAPRTRPSSLAIPLPLPSDGMGLSHVTFAYEGSPKPLLQDFTLHIPPGDKVAIVGDIGSGKSTVIKLLLQYYTPQQGVAYYQGRPYHDLPLHTLRQKIGYVPQHPILFNRTVAENILYGNPQISRTDLEAFLNQVGVYQEFQNLDQGLDTPIGKNGSKLSGGQKQLVWFLRILLSNPDVLILDEPTASVDQRTKDILHMLLQRFFHDKTIIMVTHDPFLMNVAQRVVRMRQGRILQDQRKHGTHASHSRTSVVGSYNASLHR